MPGRSLLVQIILAMAAFAANSVLCRLALKGGHIDPVSFSHLRLVSGALVLLPFLFAKRLLSAPAGMRSMACCSWRMPSCFQWPILTWILVPARSCCLASCN